MPLAAKRPCAHQPCPKLVSDQRYCDDHKQHKNDADLWRGTAASRGYDSAWKSTRLLALKRDKYLCQHCLAAGRVTPAFDVDHIKSLAAGGDRLDLGNLQSLCRVCHKIKTAADHRRRDPKG